MMNTLTLNFYESRHLNDVTGYTLPAEQISFTALPEAVFERLEQRTDSDARPVTIMLSGVPIGFFVLDYGTDKYDLTSNTDSLLVRSLSVNPIYQGKGYGKKAMELIDDFVQEHYPAVNELVLAVNAGNDTAFKMYVAVGYAYEGKTREGIMGTQLLLSKKIG